MSVDSWPVPPGLGLAGHRLWDALIESYVVTPAEAVLAGELCALADDMSVLRGQLAGLPLLVAGSTGQQVINPLRLELHRVSARFESIVKTMGFPAPEELTDAQARSWAGRNLARQRWS